MERDVTTQVLIEMLDEALAALERAAELIPHVGEAAALWERARALGVELDALLSDTLPPLQPNGHLDTGTIIYTDW